MICSAILTVACNLISEASGAVLSAADFSARAPYIIASFCGMASAVDKHYRKGFSLGAQPAFNRAQIDLTAQFPLADRFVPSAAAYLASMLIAPENPDLAAALRKSSRDDLMSAYNEIPWTQHEIVDKNS